MSADTRPNSLLRLYSALLVACSFLIPAILLARLVLSFRHEYFLTHVEGAWLTCAYDFLHGVFYRPLFSSLGYGGTRYFPLYFVVTGLCSKIFGSLETSGLAVSGGCVIALCYVTYVLLRRLNVSLLLSVAGVTAVLAASTTQQALISAKGDSLAAVLNLWGVVLCLKSKISRASLFIAAFFFTLAFTTKLTTVFGVAAVVVAWALARRYKEAVQLALATGCGFVLVLVGMYVGSDGRVFAIFRACAGGGGSLSYTLQAPIHMLSKTLDVDPLLIFFFVPAAVVALAWLREDKTQILPIYFVLSFLVAVVIFTSPGIGVNHLLDLHVASVVLIILAISRRPEFAETSIGLLAMTLLIACITTGRDLHGDRLRRSFPEDAREAVLRIPSGATDDRPILAENAVVVLEAGKTPYLLDPFMFRILALTHPALAKDFWERMTHRRFSAVILQRDPHSDEGKVWYTETHFGGEFLHDLDANYELSYTVGQMRVFTPKPLQP
jgi:hypothetical protein